MACGKSSATLHLSELLGCPSANADEIVARLLENDARVQQALTERFGQSILTDGRVDRDQLRQRVFSSELDRRALEEILHPRVRDDWRQQLSRGRQRRLFHYLVEIPLLFEVGAEKELDLTVAIACSRETQLSRLLQRPSMDEKTALGIIDAQLDTSEKVNRADFVIWNDGSREEFYEQCRILSFELRVRAQNNLS